MSKIPLMEFQNLQYGPGKSAEAGPSPRITSPRNMTVIAHVMKDMGRQGQFTYHRDCWANGSVNQKVAPSPAVLCTPTCP